VTDRRPPQWFLDEAARQGTPDPVAPYERLDLRVDPERVHQVVVYVNADRPRFPVLTWLLVIAIVAAAAFLIANRSAPRSAHQSTVELGPSAGTTAGAGDTSLPVNLGASAAGPIGAPPFEGAGGAPQILDPRVGREGDIAYADTRRIYVAIPLGPGIRIRVCGPASCEDMVSTDAGPNRAMLLEGRIMDLDLNRWERICGMQARFGLCPGSWVRISAAAPTLPPTDVAP
jgi:hypothetical protein